MNSHKKMEKAKEEIEMFKDHMQRYNGDINKHKVINELDKILEILGD